MEQHKNTANGKIKCRKSSCMQCEHCRAVNSEEKRLADIDIVPARSLYDAEATFYYFHFLPTTNRA